LATTKEKNGEGGRITSIKKAVNLLINYWRDYFLTTYSIICFLIPVKGDRFLFTVFFSGTYFIFSLLNRMFGESLYMSQIYGLIFASIFLIVAWLGRLPVYREIWRPKK